YRSSAVRRNNIESNVRSLGRRRQTDSEGGRYRSAISFRDRYIVDRKIRRGTARAVIGGRTRIARGGGGGEEIARIVVCVGASAGLAEICAVVVVQSERCWTASLLTGDQSCGS